MMQWRVAPLRSLLSVAGRAIEQHAVVVKRWCVPKGECIALAHSPHYRTCHDVASTASVEHSWHCCYVERCQIEVLAYYP